MPFWTAKVEFKGNHSKQYDYFVETPVGVNGEFISGLMPRLQNLAICQTGSGFSLGRIVALSDKLEESKATSFITTHFPEEAMKKSAERFAKEMEKIKKPAVEEDPLADLMSDATAAEEEDPLAGLL